MSDMRLFEKSIDTQKDWLKRVNEGITEGISEGVREGVASGLKKGVREALKDCLATGFINIGEDDIIALLREVPEKIIKNSIKESARQLFKKSTEVYLHRVCRRLLERIEKDHVELTKEQTEDIRALIEKCEREALGNAFKRLPDNPFLKEITSGIQAALEESLKSGFEPWGDRLQKGATDGLDESMETYDRDEELKKSVKKSVKNIVKETVSDITSQIAKASTKTIIKKLTKRLKEKALNTLEHCSHEICEQGLDGMLDKSAAKVTGQLNRSIEDVAEKTAKDGFDQADLTRKLERDLEKSFRKPLRPSVFKSTAITLVCVIVVAGTTWAFWPSPGPGPQPKPATPIPPAEIPGPDLVITDLWYEPVVTAEGGIFHYVIENWGDGEAGATVTALFIGNQVFGEDPTGPLASGESRDGSISSSRLTPTPETRVCADAPNIIEETDEDNNCMFYEVGAEPLPSPKPDLVITRVWHQAEEMGNVIYFNIANQGKGEAAASHTYLIYNGNVAAINDVGPLAPGDVITSDFSFYFLPAGEFSVELRADGDNQVDESNEDNNRQVYANIL